MPPSPSLHEQASLSRIAWDSALAVILTALIFGLMPFADIQRADDALVFFWGRAV